MIICMLARHFHLYVRGTLLVVQVSGAIWVSWYLGQSQTDKNTESTATPPNTYTQCWLFCSSKLLQIYQRTNKKEAHIHIVPNPNVHCCVNFFSQIYKQWRRRSVHRYSNCQPKWAISVSWETIKSSSCLEGLCVKREIKYAGSY